MQTKVLIAVPTMGSIHTLLVSRLIRWSKEMKGGNYYFTFRMTPHDRARNELVDFFLKNDEFTHIFFVDSDTIPPENALQKLLSHDLPFVTALTPIMQYNEIKGAYETFDNCFLEPVRDEAQNVKETPIAERNTGLQKIYRSGGACMLVKREVFEKLSSPYFKFEYNGDGTKHTRSEDIYFCDAMREAGYDLYADTTVYCKHQKEMLL